MAKGTGKRFHIAQFDYGAAEATLEKAGCRFPEQIWERETEQAISELLEHYGLDPAAFKRRKRA